MTTLESVSLVQNSFARVLPIADTAADIFYTRLFEIAPELRALFPDDMSEQKDKLMQMLATAVNNLHEFETILPAVQELGRRHVAYGVVDGHYDKVGQALLFALEKGLGDQFTQATRDAWIETYATLATVMKAAAAEVTVAERR